MNIDMVGNNMTQAQGMCGSSSGSIPTNVGQPMIRVKEITVGGREEEIYGIKFILRIYYLKKQVKWIFMNVKFIILIEKV